MAMDMEIENCELNLLLQDQEMNAMVTNLTEDQSAVNSSNCESSHSTIKADGNWPSIQSAAFYSPIPNPIHSMFGVIGMDTGLTPTPTNDNVNFPSPIDATTTPKTNLDANFRGSRTSTGSGKKSNSSMNSNGEPMDSSGISSGTDLSESFHAPQPVGAQVHQQKQTTPTTQLQNREQEERPQHILQQQPQLRQQEKPQQQQQQFIPSTPSANSSFIGSQVIGGGDSVANTSATSQANAAAMNVAALLLQQQQQQAAAAAALYPALAAYCQPFYGVGIPYQSPEFMRLASLGIQQDLNGFNAAEWLKMMSNSYVQPGAGGAAGYNLLPTLTNVLGSPTAVGAAGLYSGTNPDLLQMASLLGNNGYSHHDDISNLAASYKASLGQETEKIERQAADYRNSAALNEAHYHWSGEVGTKPGRLNSSNITYSRKIFVGGIPWDTEEANLFASFSKFGAYTVIWPTNSNPDKPPPKGFCYLVFENECSVHCLVKNLRKVGDSGELYYIVLNTKKITGKEVEVIPWDIEDSSYTVSGSAHGQHIREDHTVFVGALHGMISSYALAVIMSDVFGPVVSVALDTDKFKYPIGSGRITFENHSSWEKAIKCNYVEIRTHRYNKKIQIDPYLIDSECKLCLRRAGIYFCRNFECFTYFCQSCFEKHQLALFKSDVHIPLRRSTNKSDAKK